MLTRLTRSRQIFNTYGNSGQCGLFRKNGFIEPSWNMFDEVG
jgi:hypothetical protein